MTRAGELDAGECVARAMMMANGDGAWDLSPNDRGAIQHILDRMRTAEACGSVQAATIKRCQADHAAHCAATIARLEGELREARAALAFYADRATYTDRHARHPGKFSRPIAYDVDERGQGGAIEFAGARARQALSTTPPDEKGGEG